VTTYWDRYFNEVQVWGVASDGHLYLHLLDRTGWHTVDHGLAVNAASSGGDYFPGVPFPGSPTAMTHWNGRYTQVEGWTLGNNGRLYARYSDATGWHTGDHGLAVAPASSGAYYLPAVYFAGRPAVTTYWDGAFDEVQVWATGSNGHLYAHYYNSSGWHTSDN